MSTEKKRRGGQTREERVEARKVRKDAKLVAEILKGEELIAENYYKCVKTIVDAALGNIKNVSPTNVISSAKQVKQWGDEIRQRKEEETKPESKGKEENTPEEKPEESGSLISLKFGG